MRWMPGVVGVMAGDLVERAKRQMWQIAGSAVCSEQVFPLLWSTSVEYRRAPW
jgi:hypothetical protein